MNEKNQSYPFYIKNCALAAIATGEKAGSLIELRDKLLVTHTGCIYYHFWGSRMHSEFVYPEYHNDFASWAFHHLHDLTLAERLSVIDPTDYNHLEQLREKLLDVIEERIDETAMVHWTTKEQFFHFIRSKIIVFETPYQIISPQDLPKMLSHMTPSSIYYHFIDARGRTAQGVDDFSLWLSSYNAGYEELVNRIRMIDPYFLTLSEIRRKFSKTIEDYFK